MSTSRPCQRHRAALPKRRRPRSTIRKDFASNPNAQLSPQQALGALQAANKSAETTYDKDTASLITVPKAQLSPRLQAELARHGLVMAGTGTGVPPPGGTIPGQPAPAGAPQQFGAAPLVRMTPDAARLQFENKTSKSTSYQDAKIAVDAANDIHDLYTNPLAEGELPFLRDQAALTKYREAVQSHIARLAAVGGSRDDIAGSQSILANINDALAAAQQAQAIVGRAAQRLVQHGETAGRRFEQIIRAGT